MPHRDFINKIAPIVQRMTAWYGYGVNSAIIAQACLESAYGTSSKAKHHNYFGLKYRENRVKCFSEIFADGSTEQSADGSYYKITDRWFGFSSMEAGVEGYLQFIAIPNYAAARAQTDPKRYLTALREAGYATSIDYVTNCMAVVSVWNLTQYDGKEVISTEPAINKMISKYNFSSRSVNAIKYIVMHYTGNQTDTAKANANYFAGGDRGASAHFFVDANSIYQSVDLNNAAWHCGKNYGSGNLFGKCTNLNSIGIEMCSTNGSIETKTINRAVDLVKWLMQKYSIPASNVVRHYDVCSKRCPGWAGWLPPNEGKWTAFKAQIGAGPAPAPAPKPAQSGVPFTVQVLTNTVNIFKGAGKKYGKTGKVTGIGKFTIVELNAKKTWGRLKSGAGWIYLKSKKVKVDTNT